MENNTQQQAKKQYEKYKPNLKKSCVLSVIANAAAIIGIVFFLFIPFFLIQIKLDDIVLQEESFSLFDAIVESINMMFNFKSSDNVYDVMTLVLGAYQIIALINLCIGVVMITHNLIKNTMAIIDTEAYALETYDKIKRGDDEKRGFSARKFSQARYFYAAVMYQVIYIIFCKAYSGLAADNSIGKLADFNAVSWTVIFCLIFFAAFIVIDILKKSTVKKVKLAILKEDYGA